MSNINKENKNLNDINYFSIFNSKLFFMPNDINETDNTIKTDSNYINESSDESSTDESINSTQDEEEFNTLNLIDLDFIFSDIKKIKFNYNDKKNENNNSTKIFNGLNIFSQPYFPKNFKNYSNNNNKMNHFCNLNYNNNTICPNDEINNNKNKKNKKNKKKSFSEREGDWPCYKCKNINFSFRKKCNKCKLLKEESEKLFEEAEKKILKLADVSVYKSL